MNIMKWNGKSPELPDGIPHPAAYHMLDVAAVAEKLIAPFAFDPSLRDALILLIALHDLGKVSDSFQAMLAGKAVNAPRHWELTEILLHLNNATLARHLGGETEARRQLYAATAGHHGRPPTKGMLSFGQMQDQEKGEVLSKTSNDIARGRTDIGTGLDDATALLEAFCALWPNASLKDLSRESAVQLSWWLPGLCAAADWVGSNTAWFPPTAPQQTLSDQQSLTEYLDTARARAEIAVTEAGLAGAAVKSGCIFDNSEDGKFILRPMQSACANVDLPDGPMLAVIEDETGAGKTEAALLLAHRMAQAGKGRGIYFALPTMATADAMFARAERIVGKMFEGPKLALAHGRAGLSMPFRDLQNAVRADEPSCTDWLASTRRRALLADVGIGTIDQALLAALPVKHQTLRHFGLSSKILIVDEVHDMGQPYVAKLLRGLLTMHRAAGGSAILLTATLPLDLRRDLLATYEGASNDPAYPALTIAGGAAITQLAADTRAVKGPVSVQRLDSVDAVLDLLTQSADCGAACAWVRNSVDEAIEAVAALRERGIAADLFHARFAFCDRKVIEERVMGTLGRNGQGRSGYVLVATQVIQASLDLDIDVMISDLAPIAELIQRAGRLWRHMDLRPAADRPVPVAILHVLSPDPDQVTTDRWIAEMLKGGAWVYPLADVWRTARVLFKAGEINAPHGLRNLIEAVHGPMAEDVPTVFAAAETKALGKNLAQSALGTQNAVDLAAGYRSAGKGTNDATFPTRLGLESQTLVLAQMVDGKLVAWANGADAWEVSEVSAAKHKLDKLPLPNQANSAILAVTKNWPEWRRESVRVCPVVENGMICEGLRYDAERGLIFA